MTLLLVLLAGCVNPACHHQDSDQVPVSIGGTHWTLELAQGEEAIQRGMMDRAAIPDGTGMLFVFDEPSIRRFWMANCLVDIDLLYLDGRGRIVSLHRMVTEPPRSPSESVSQYERRLPLYASGSPVRFAIELPAGSIDRLGLKSGDRIPLDLAMLKGGSRL